MRSLLIKKRNITIVSVLLIAAVLCSCMLPLLCSQPDLLPSLSANAADDTSTGVKIKRYDSLDAFKQDYPKDAAEYEFALKDDVDYSGFQVVVSQETSGENFAIFFDAKQYPKTMVTDTMFSNFGIQYCKYLNTLKAITGKSNGVLNIFPRMAYEGGFSPGSWTGTRVQLNGDFTDGLMTAIMQCTTTDFYTSWCLLHETSHSYGESYFNIHSETSVNLRSLAAIHAMGNGKTETDPHFHTIVDYDPTKDKIPAATVPNKFYSSELYMDSFIANTLSAARTFNVYYKSLDDVDPFKKSSILYDNCSTLDTVYLSAITKTNLFNYSDGTSYRELVYNTLTGSTCKIDWDRFYAQFIVNPEIIKDSFMYGALKIYDQFSSIYSLEKIPTCVSVLNKEDNTIKSSWDNIYVTEETKKFLSENGYLCSNGLYKGSYTASQLLIRFYDSLYMVSGSCSLDLLDNVSSDFTFTQFIDRLLNTKYYNYGTAPTRCTNYRPATTILFGGQTVTISADNKLYPLMGRLVDGQEVLSGTVQWQNYTTQTNIENANSIVCDITPPVGLTEYEMLMRTINETGSEYALGHPGHHLVYAFSQPTLVDANGTTPACLSVVAGFENASSIDFTSKRIAFQWQSKSGSTWSDIPGATSPTYELSPESTAKTYRCIITSKDKQIISDAVTVYTVQFDANGGSCDTASRSVTNNSTYGTLPTTTRTGYNFAGWFTAATGGTKVTADSKYTTDTCSTLYAHWTAKTLKATFHRNMSSSDTVTGTETFTYDVENQKFGYKPDGTARYSTMQPESKGFGTWTNTGYSMLGWSIDKNATDKTYNTYSSVTNSWIDNNSPSIDLYAVWKANSYTVTFNASGGTCPTKSKSAAYNSTYGTLPEPARTGYTFAGWYTAATGGTKVTADSKYTTAADSTLYAHWTSDSFTVTFDANGGTCPTKSSSVTYNSTYGTLPEPARTGYTFAGWYTAETGGTKVTADSKYTAAADSTLYAHWTAKTITVTLHRNTSSSDTVTGAETFTYDVENQKFGYKPDGTARYSTMQTGSKGFGTWTKTGYSMLGWNTEPDQPEATYDIYSSVPNYFIDSYSPNIDLYAIWTANRYTITFNANGGTCWATSKSVNYNNTYGTLPEPTRTGYDFAGWYTAATDGTEVTEDSKYTTAANSTLYAHWTASKYTATGNGNGDANDDGTVNVADAVAVLQYIANRERYPLTDKQQANADCDGTAGITGGDAITIQKVDAGILVLQ